MDCLCCICLKSNTSLTNIVDCKEDSLSYMEKLKLCVAQIEWKDYFKICNDCASKTKDAYEFYILCMKNEKLRDQSTYTIDEAKSGIHEAVSESETCHNEISHRKKYHKRKTRAQSSHGNGKINRENHVIDAKYEATDISFDGISSDVEVDSENKVRDVCPEPQKATIVSKPSLHKKKSKVKEPIKCSYCGREFKRKEHLSAHIRAKHTLEKPYACDICNTSFSMSQSLLIHKRRHNNERPYCCTYCGKQFSCSSDIYHHNQIHLNKRQYKCDSCEKSFNTASILRRHKICAHTDPLLWKYICIHCNRRFPMSGNLKTHLRRHDNEKNFTCGICSKSFYDKFILKRHMRSHTDERLFKCVICKKEYKDNCSLNIHLKKVHDIGTAVIPRRSKNFVCHICPKAFASDDKLKKHINAHSGAKPFQCSECDKSFTDNWYRRKHLEKIHNVTEV